MSSETRCSRNEIPIPVGVQWLPVELYYRIFRLLHSEVHKVNGPLSLTAARRDFAALARTCRSFCDPALDILWEEMDSLVPLLRLMVPAVRLERLPDGSTKYPICYTLAGPLDADEWHRYDQYRSRVRYLCSSDHTALRPTASILNTTIFDTFAQLRPDMLPVLPNIQRLEWEQYNSSSSLSHFIAPSLKVLTIGRSLGLDYMGRNRDLRALERILQDLPDRVPALQTLKLDNQEMFDRSLQGLIKLHKLEILTLLGPISADIRRSLSRMMQLKSISLCSRHSSLEEDGSMRPSFPELESITFIHSPARIIVSVLQQLSSTKLSHFRLDSGAERQFAADAEELQQIFDALGQFKQTLKAVSIVRILSSLVFVDSQFLRPLLKCQEITELEFSFYILPSDMDDEMKRLAWPKLNRLVLSCNISARRLVTLADHFPNLKHLFVNLLTMSDIPSIDTIRHMSPHPLETLQARGIGMVDLPEMVRKGITFLDTLFPFLSKTVDQYDEQTFNVYTHLGRMLQNQEQ